MVVEKDIVAISIPFSAGVIMAAQVPPGSDLLWPVAGGACLAAAALLCLACRPGHRNGTLAGLFFLLGVFCGANAALSFAPPVRADFAGRALSGLARSIEGAGFSHENTAELLKALLTGNRDGMDRGTVAAFRTAGASHLLCIWVSSTESCKKGFPCWAGAAPPCWSAAPPASARPPSTSP